MNVNLSEKIVELRRRAGLSQRALGIAVGVTNRAVSKWEAGISLPTIENLLALARVFHIPPEAFFEEKEKRALRGARDTRMESLKELYRIGYGPSSSHTMGPERAARIFLDRYPNAERYVATLYGSLAKTAVGHGTENVLQKTFAPHRLLVVLDTETSDLPHENTFDLAAYNGDEEVASLRFLSVGGGRIVCDAIEETVLPRPYPVSTFREIRKTVSERRIRLWQYAEEIEGPSLFPFLSVIWRAMCESIERGLEAGGVLPGGLSVVRRARSLIRRVHIDESPETRENREVCAYAFAVGEENAAGGRIVTAPTCGAAGVLPAVLYYEQKKRGLPDEAVLRALATGGLVGNLVKTRASISGAECGCQAEIGTACAMAAAALGELYGLGLDEIEYAAEIAIEHHLGLTCDPVCGLVQIPCIERNAVAAMRAKNAVNLSSFLADSRKLTLDAVIEALDRTGRDLATAYRETSEGGLARLGILEQ